MNARTPIAFDGVASHLICLSSKFCLNSLVVSLRHRRTAKLILLEIKARAMRLQVQKSRIQLPESPNRHNSPIAVGFCRTSASGSVLRSLRG